MHPQYNYTISSSDTSENGLYYGSQLCCNPSIGCANDYSFQIHFNAQGKDNSNDGIIYAVMFGLLIILFSFSVFSFVRIPFSNQRDGDGVVVNVDWKKYLKIGSGVLAYVCLVGVIYFAWNLSYGILQFNEMANFFYVLFRVSFIGMFLILPGVFIFTIVKFIQDKIVYEKIMRGLTVR